MAEPGAPGVITYRYTFTFPSGEFRTFTIRLDNRTLELLRPANSSPPPAWTALGFQQCPHCPLKERESPHCPAALSLVDILDVFGQSVSYQEAEVCIETEARSYARRTTLQKALSSLIGLHMVTSGCPVMGKLKPMVRHHLPFARLDETIYRALGTYLLAQYFLARRGRKPDWEMKELVGIYDDIGALNKAFSKRLGEASSGDASLNALAILDVFASSVTFSVTEHMLDELELLFQPYLSDLKE